MTTRNGEPKEDIGHTDTKKARDDEFVSSQQAANKSWGLLFMVLLAMQIGFQPILSRKCVSRGIVITSQVLACEIVKILISLTVIGAEGNGVALVRQWTLVGAMTTSALPATIYAVQNTMIQMAYRHLDYLTFSMLNQTKLMFTALFNYLFLGKRQSGKQIAALMVLLVAATMLTAGGKQSKSKDFDVHPDDSFWLGIVPVLIASALSGFASTICQWVVQVKGRSPYLMTVEMSVIGSIVLLFSLGQSADGAKIAKLGFFHSWTLVSMIPVVTNSLGGILVGLVTKYSGGVKKGFVNVSALLVTAIAQYLIDGAPPTFYVWLALPLVVGSTYIHSSYPFIARVKKIE